MVNNSPDSDGDSKAMVRKCSVSIMHCTTMQCNILVSFLNTVIKTKQISTAMVCTLSIHQHHENVVIASVMCYCNWEHGEKPTPDNGKKS